MTHKRRHRAIKWAREGKKQKIGSEIFPFYPYPMKEVKINMTTLEIHFNHEDCDVIENVTAYWQNREYWHVRTLFGNCPEERMYAKKNVIAVFEVINDEQRRII